MHKEKISTEEALERIRTLISKPNFLMSVETVPLPLALGRIVAHDLTSDIDVTPFDNTAMDGFALRSIDAACASIDTPSNFEIIDWIGAGDVSKLTVGPHQAIRIMTGAIMPEGADCVEKIESTILHGEGAVGDTVTLTAPIAAGRNVRFAGEECKKGAVVVYAGEELNPSSLGLLASTGNQSVPVYSRPKVGILSLGSELVAPEEMPEPGKIRDSNASALAGGVIAAGGIPHIYPIVSDDKESISGAIRAAATENDMVITSGGACDGDFDYSIQSLREIGEVIFDLVDMRPGKSQAFGCIGNTPVSILSGNPAAAVVGFELFCRPALRLMQGYKEIEHPHTTALLKTDTQKRGNRVYYQRGHLEKAPDGTLYAVQEKMQSSALLSELHHSTVLIKLPSTTGTIPAGTPVDCIRLDIKEGTIL